MGKLSVSILVIAGLLLIGIVIIATDFQWLWLPLAHSEQYSSKIAALFMAVSAWVTLLVVFAAFQTIKQSADREKRDRKERIIREIVEWAAGIDTKFLGTNAKNISGLPLLDVKNIALGTIFSCSSALAKGSYFRTLASNSFNSTDVIEDINSIIVNLDAIICIKKKELGYPNPGEGFDGDKKLKALFDEKQDTIKLPKKLDEFTIEYGNKLAVSINGLFKHAANIISP